MLTNGGTCTTRPVSSVAGLTCALAVARLMPGDGVHDFQVDRDRQLDADRLLAVELHRDDRLGQDVVGVVAQHLGVDVDLLVAARVHEMERVAVTVEVLHLPLVEDGAFDVLFGAELVVGLQAGADVAHLGLDESALVAGREVLEIENPEEVVLELDQHAALQSCRLN